MSESIFDFERSMQDDPFIDNCGVLFDNIDFDLESSIDRELFETYDLKTCDFYSNGVHTIFNEIADMKPANSSSSDEDDKNLITKFDFDELNFSDDSSAVIQQSTYGNEVKMESDAASPTSDSYIEIESQETAKSPDIVTAIPMTAPSLPQQHIYVLNETSAFTRIPVIKVNPGRTEITLANKELSEIESKDVHVTDSKKSIKNNVWITPISPDTKSMTQKEIMAFKRRQRMIKNREAASLSRKKKKDYVTSLEHQIEELILRNQLLKEENDHLKGRLSKYETSPSKRQFSKTGKTTFILAVVLLISFNYIPFRNFVPYSANELVSEDLSSINLNKDEFSYNSRSLLWIDETESSNITSEESSNLSLNSSDLKCPMFINHTEALRLDSELRKWIDTYPADNVTSIKKRISKNKKLMQFSPYKISNKRDWPFLRLETKPEETIKAGVDVYGMEGEIPESRPWFEAMERKQDTFYVVSFSGDHLLWPSFNKTLIPKMSLVLPSITTNDSLSSTGDVITMMQIDCAVTDTRLLYVKQENIPAHFRNHSTKNLRKSKYPFSK